MTEADLRDLFAGIAMHGIILGNAEWSEREDDEQVGKDKKANRKLLAINPESASRIAYLFADHMLLERSKIQEEIES